MPIRSNVRTVRERSEAPIGSRPSRAKQEFKNDCDINNILAKFKRTGALHHFAKHSPSYGDFSPRDYQDSLNVIIRAQKMFDDLPSNIRKEVETPEGFLKFVQNPENADRMVELGLKPKPPAAPIEAPPVTPPPPT